MHFVLGYVALMRANKPETVICVPVFEGVHISCMQLPGLPSVQ